MSDAIKAPLKHFRAPVSRGVGEEHSASADAGMYSAGVIRDVSVITTGEALGHGMWIDAEMLTQVADGINGNERGVKSRFTHPSLSGDGMGRGLGRVTDAYVAGDHVYADLHFGNHAHNTPDGDLAGYVMQLAREDPESFGMSIVFDLDERATEGFAALHVGDDGDFVSPDADNDRNLPHARVEKMHAADVVDEPAANPSGLFHRGQEIPAEADALVAYAFGLADTPPINASLCDPGRLRAFAARFLESRNLQITERIMQDENTEVELDAQPEVTDDQAEGVQPEPEAEVQPEIDEVEQAEDEAKTAELSEGQRFLNEFGTQGAIWYAEGRSYDEAKALHIDAIKADNEALAKRVAELEADRAEARGGEALELEPVEDAKQLGLRGAVRIAGQDK